MSTSSPRREQRIAAMLGPTNTGKTHYAVERMLSHRNGMIGFPLRLLARENYDRIVAIKGPEAVSLITGEEKRIPENPDYHICTVEAMPSLPVDFVAVDEIQLAADRERGHVFTDRLLHWRGQKETLFLGAQTIEYAIRCLIPGIEIINRPRLSRLSHIGPHKLTRLPRRSAVVAFSVDAVYALAEDLRATSGGVAVVLGGLSPSARNAQADMFQSGEVDYLVATDAIGMGLNMDIDHVAFGALRKFDGQKMRHLTTPELAQIAGRAGRYIRDGSFGTTNRLGFMRPSVVEDIESHHFDPVTFLWWRAAELDFSSPRALIASLDQPPAHEQNTLLRRAPQSADRLALGVLATWPEITERIQTPENVRLLWELCRVPDYRKSLGDEHHRLLARMFIYLRDGVLPDSWLNRQINRLDRIDGGIDMLSTRIAHIRIWNYVAFQEHWLDRPDYWRNHTRQIEDRLSAALHEALVQRFVDRQTTLVHRLASSENLSGLITPDGRLMAGKECIGRFDGLGFTIRPVSSSHPRSRQDEKRILKVMRPLLEQESQRRAAALVRESNTAFTLTLNGHIEWRGARIARLKPGSSLSTPDIEMAGDRLLATKERDRIQHYLGQWLATYLRERLAPLWQLESAPLSPVGRGLAFQLREMLGSIPRFMAADCLSALKRPDRRSLRQAGLVIGRQGIFFSDLLEPSVIALRGLLWKTRWCKATDTTLSLPTDIISQVAWPPGYAQSIGYHLIPLTINHRIRKTADKKKGRSHTPHRRPSGVAVRMDRMEDIAAEVWKCGKHGPFTIGTHLTALTGNNPKVVHSILRSLGTRSRRKNGIRYYSLHHPANRSDKAAKPPDLCSPFSILNPLLKFPQNQTP